MTMKHVSVKKLMILIGDIAIIACAYFFAPIIRFGVPVIDVSSGYLIGLFVLMFVFLICFYIGDLYSFKPSFGSLPYLFKVALSAALACILSIAAFYFLAITAPGRGILAILSILIGFTAYGWRLFLSILFKKVLAKPKITLIVGAGRTGRALYNLLKDDPHFNVVGFIDRDPGLQENANYPEVLGGHEVLRRYSCDKYLDQIIVAIKQISDADLLSLLLQCKLNGIAVYDVPRFYEVAFGKVHIEHLTDAWLINMSVAAALRSVYNTKIKRVMGVVIAVIALIVSFLICLVIALFIKLDSPGPVFYIQKRVGFNGKTFDLVKFRSMKVDAENDKPVWASIEDERVTRVGRIIRRLRMDELPQLWNVLKGEMTLLGPRPERPDFVEMLNKEIPYYSLRHAVRPGLSGWAQVNYGYGASKEDAVEKLQYDLYYVKNLSIFLDAYIMLRTLRVVLLGIGAR